MNATKTLRKDITAAKGVTPGTIIRFDRTFPKRNEMTMLEGENVTVTYAAIFIAGHWFLTGVGRMATKRYPHRDFVDLLADDSISRIEVATEFEAL